MEEVRNGEENYYFTSSGNDLIKDFNHFGETTIKTTDYDDENDVMTFLDNYELH